MPPGCDPGSAATQLKKIRWVWGRGGREGWGGGEEVEGGRSWWRRRRGEGSTLESSRNRRRHGSTPGEVSRESSSLARIVFHALVL